MKKQTWIKILLVVNALLIALLVFMRVNIEPKGEDIKQGDEVVEVLPKGPTVDDYRLIVKDLFEQYGSLNDDYVGQIVIENDLINLPFVQSKLEDQTAAYNQYLRTDFMTNEHDEEGSIFMDPNNDLDDQNIVIYGHYVYPFLDPDQTHKFSPLHQLKDEANYEDHNEIQLYLQDEIRTYQIANVYYVQIILDEDGYETVAPGSEYMYKNYTSEEFAAYFEYINANEFYDTGIDIDEDGRFLTLQTCVENRDDLRLIIVAKEIEVIEL